MMMATTVKRPSDGGDGPKDWKSQRPLLKTGQFKNWGKSPKFLGAASSSLVTVAILLLLVNITTAQIAENDPRCLRQGGICAIRESCPEDSRLQFPCEAQENSVCCSRIPNNVSCRDRGGRCGGKPECQNVQNFGQMDCPKGTQCCLLIF